MYRYRFSNTAIGYLNLVTMLAAIPVIGGGLWMSRSSATCEQFLQTPLLVIGFVVLLVSLAGFIGACFNIVWALWFYLCLMLLLIPTLLGLTLFGFVVTAGGGGSPVPGHLYREYHLNDYHPWLRHHLAAAGSWAAARSCIVSSKACSKIAAWTPLDYVEHDLSPVQSGCCKPPTSCRYDEAAAAAVQEEDCYRWSNAAEVLCYNCKSCKAGALEEVKRDWRKVAVLNLAVLAFMAVVCSMGCCAFRNARRAGTDFSHGENNMSKVRPRWDYYWWRWWYDRKDQLY